MNTTLQKSLAFILCQMLALGAASLGDGQEAVRPVNVVIKDGKLLAAEAPVDPTPRIEAQYVGMMFGLTVEGKKITCLPQNSVIPLARIDNQVAQPGFDPMTGQQSQQQPLPPGPFGKKRLGTQTKWTQNNLHFTQVVEIVPSRLGSMAVEGDQRRLDTVRISCVVENKDKRDHLVEYRMFMDTMINDNDGALFAAPTTAPGVILDGVVLKDRSLPEYLQVLEKADVKNPGFVAVMTLKFGGKVEGPSKVVLGSTAGFNFGGGFDVGPQKANGDSACYLYWAAKTLKPGAKREMVWAYGGGIASNTGNDDNVRLTLGGSFAPGKLFTIQATIDDPAPGETLTLELPDGMVRIEGAERQPVPVPPATGHSLVLWKARVAQLGQFELKVHSSTGVTLVKNVSIQAAK